jgi:hypothetical protein
VQLLQSCFFPVTLVSHFFEVIVSFVPFEDDLEFLETVQKGVKWKTNLGGSGCSSHPEAVFLNVVPHNQVQDKCLEFVDSLCESMDCSTQILFETQGTAAIKFSADPYYSLNQILSQRVLFFLFFFQKKKLKKEELYHIKTLKRFLTFFCSGKIPFRPKRCTFSQKNSVCV